MPVTDTSKGTKRHPPSGWWTRKWICARAHGYTVNKRKEFEVVPTRDIVRRIFDHYNNDGWGATRKFPFLTAQGIPTPRVRTDRRGSAGEEPAARGKAWAIVTVQGILDNDFYIAHIPSGQTTGVKTSWFLGA